MILERHLRLNDAALAKIFPGMPPARGNFAQMLAA
jgi:hypothetical protein